MADLNTNEAWYMNASTPIEYGGITYSSYRELATAKGMNPNSLRYRLESGMSVHDAVNRPLQSTVKVRLFGKDYASINEARRAMGTPRPRYRDRRTSRDWPLLLALAAPSYTRLSDFSGYELDLENMSKEKFDEVVKEIRAKNAQEEEEPAPSSESPLPDNWLTRSWK